MRAQLSRARAQLHAAQLQLQRHTGALATTRQQLAESEATQRTLQLRLEDLQAVGGGGGGGDGGGGGRSALVELAERRLAELEAELKRKDQQLQQLQASSWGAWAEDMAVQAELERLQQELTPT